MKTGKRCEKCGAFEVRRDGDGSVIQPHHLGCEVLRARRASEQEPAAKRAAAKRTTAKRSK